MTKTTFSVFYALEKKLVIQTQQSSRDYKKKIDYLCLLFIDRLV